MLGSYKFQELVIDVFDSPPAGSMSEHTSRSKEC